MGPLFLSALLLIAPAYADVVKVAEADDTAYYVDASSISERDDLLRVSVVQDYSKPDFAGVRSRTVLYEIDCVGERLRSIAGVEYSEAMARGQSVNSWQRESAWLYVAAKTGSHIAVRSPYRSIVKFVCSR